MFCGRRESRTSEEGFFARRSRKSAATPYRRGASPPRFRERAAADGGLRMTTKPQAGGKCRAGARQEKNRTLKKQRMRHPRSKLVGSGFGGIAEELDEQRAHDFGLLLLNPMAGAIDEMKADHVRARAIAHLVHRARRLVDAPIALPRDVL
jgi:hypothetical protein